jgi:hypothetical protein
MSFIKVGTNEKPLDYRQTTRAMYDGGDRETMTPYNANVTIDDQETAQSEFTKAVILQDHLALNRVFKTAELMLAPEQQIAIYDSVENLSEVSRKWFRDNYGKPVLSVYVNDAGKEVSQVVTPYSGGGGYE